MVYTVLHIEDEPLIIELVRDVLAHPDVMLVTALTGREGLAKIRELKPDIVLLDIMMPDCDGWSIYREIRADEELGQTPIIMLTALTHRYRIQREFEKSLITKPFSARDIRTEIEKMLGVQLWPTTPRSRDR
jgi:CheY-like chemotaxis protein